MWSAALSVMAPTSKSWKKPEPALIEHKGFRFLITERPSESTMDKFIEDVKKHNATDVIRAGGAPYRTNRLLQEGIEIVDLQYEDGTTPSNEIISAWCRLLKFRRMNEPNCCVAVHCVAGLGRAPVLVAIALMEMGMKYEDAVELIRRKRHGAINAKQLEFLAKYRPRSRLSVKNKSCIVM